MAPKKINQLTSNNGDPDKTWVVFSENVCCDISRWQPLTNLPIYSEIEVSRCLLKKIILKWLHDSNSWKFSSHSRLIYNFQLSQPQHGTQTQSPCPTCFFKKTARHPYTSSCHPAFQRRKQRVTTQLVVLQGAQGQGSKDLRLQVSRKMSCRISKWAMKKRDPGFLG